MPNNRGLSANPNDKAKNFSESLKRLLKIGGYNVTKK